MRQTGYSIEFYPRLCFGCYACEVACKQENGLTTGVRLIRLITSESEDVTGRPYIEYGLQWCIHCEEAPCIEACDLGAIKRNEDGITFVEESCNGCRECLLACPYGGIQLDEVKNAVQLCNLCAHRLDVGLEPSCVQCCVSKALVLVTS